MALSRRTVCSECFALLRQSKSSHPSQLSPSLEHRSRSFSVLLRSTPIRQIKRAPLICSNERRSRRLATAKPTNKSPQPGQSVDLTKLHNRVEELSNSVLRPTDSPIPSEQRILYVLEQLESLSSSLVDKKELDGAKKAKSAPSSSKQETATSALLGSMNARQYPAFISRASLLNVISQKAEEMMRHANVFITPAILKSYVELQTFLHQPSSFPDIFDLYANKLIPKPGSTGEKVEYTPATPDKISSAIDSKTANMALSLAMQTHDLSLAIDIIMTSFSTSAFKRSKILRQAGIPIAGFTLAPVAAYSLSTQFSQLQQTMEPGMATGIAFAGIMTYVGAVSMVGYVAVTTANDQMDRVTWATGVPLWERWIREEERAAIDRVAGAWGFRDREKRGDEEGEDWETLREWVGSRGMVLDRVSLMEGME